MPNNYVKLIKYGYYWIKKKMGILWIKIHKEEIQIQHVCGKTTP